MLFLKVTVRLHLASHTRCGVSSTRGWGVVRDAPRRQVAIAGVTFTLLISGTESTGLMGKGRSVRVLRGKCFVWVFWNRLCLLALPALFTRRRRK